MTEISEIICFKECLVDVYDLIQYEVNTTGETEEIKDKFKLALFHIEQAINFLSDAEEIYG